MKNQSMRDVTLAFLVFLIGIGSVKMFEEAFSHYPITGVIIFSLGFSGLIAFIIGNIKFGKPKIVFGEYSIGIIDGIEDTFTLTNTLLPRCPYCWVFLFQPKPFCLQV